MENDGKSNRTFKKVFGNEIRKEENGEREREREKERKETMEGRILGSKEGGRKGRKGGKGGRGMEGCDIMVLKLDKKWP